LPTSAIIDLVIGLVFVFGVTAALSSAVTELIARFLGLRAAYLLTGLRELVDAGTVPTVLGQALTDYQGMQKIMRHAPDAPVPPPPVTGALLGGPILGNQGMTGQMSGRSITLGTAGPQTGNWLSRRISRCSQLRGLPSYIPAKSFAEAVIDLVVPDAAGQTTMDVIKANVDALPDTLSPFKPSLQALVKTAGNDISQFRTAVERWYDDHMSRVSGWYKRHVAIITLVVGAILVVLLNLNALTIGRTLYTQSTVNAAVSTVAAKATNCSPGLDCLEQIQGELSAAATAGLPIGWGTVRDCTVPQARCNWWDRRGLFSRHGGSFAQFVLVLIGFLIMVISIVPGAQFWFGLLCKLGSLRAAGPPPPGAGTVAGTATGTVAATAGGAAVAAGD